jgi:glycosyltransferase involved in cell wall biosynthesis
MKILYLATEFPGATEVSDVIPGRAPETATLMAQRGHEVQVLVASDRRRSWEYQRIVCNEFVVGTRDSAQTNPYDAIARKVFAKADYYLSMLYQVWVECVDLFRRGFVPDIIESPEWYGIGYFYVHHRLLGCEDAVAPMVTACNGPLFLLAEHEGMPTHAKPFPWLMNKEKFQLAGSDGLLALSHFVSESIHRRLHVDRPVVHYPTSIHANPKSHLPACDNDELLFLGPISAARGILPFLKICTYLWEEGEKFLVKLLGKSTHYSAKNIDMVDHIRQAYGKYVNEGSLRILPQPNNFQEIRNAIANSRAVVNPSRFEAMSRSCIEAMAHGRPVLGSTSGGHAELVEHGKSGFIYNDQVELEHHLRRVIKASRSELEDLGSNANRRVCDLCAPEPAVFRTEEYYQQVIDDSVRNARQVFPCPGFLDKRRFPVFPSPDDKSDHEQKSEPGLLSIIITCFNLGVYLREAVESVRASNYRPVEVIVIDDASTDEETKHEVRSLPSEFPDEENFSLRILFQKRNVGSAQLRNLGASLARGEYLCFLDADDRIDPTYFSKGISAFNKFPNVGLVSCWADFFGELEGSWLPLTWEYPQAFTENPCHSAALVRNRAFQGQREIPISPDNEGWVSVMEKGWSEVAIPEMLFFYRIRSDSMFQGASLNELKISRDAIVGYHLDLFRLFGDDIFLHYYHNFHFETKSLERDLASVTEQYQRAMDRIRTLESIACARKADLVGQAELYPAQVRKLSYEAVKNLVPLDARIAIRKALGVPAGTNLLRHVFEWIPRRLKRILVRPDSHEKR